MQFVELELDDKPSIIIDYRNGGGDEIRLVNMDKRIYLGRWVIENGLSMDVSCTMRRLLRLSSTATN